MRTSGPALQYAVLLAVVAACGGSEDAGLGRVWEASHDLLAELPAADLLTEVAAVDPGSRDSRRYLVSGWSQGDRERGADQPYFWGTGRATEIELPIFELSDRTLGFECRPLAFPGAPTQTLTVELGDREIARIDLARGRSGYGVRLAAEDLRFGRNRLRFGYAYSRAPREVVAGNDDRRTLAVAWYGLRLDPASPRAPRVEDHDRLFLPFGAQLDFYLDLEPGSFLAAGDWTFRQAAGGRLEVFLRPEGGEEKLLATLRRPPRNGRLRLTGGAGRIARLRLRAVRDGGSGEDGGVLLEAPAIVRPRARPPSAAPDAAAVLAGPGPRPPVVLYMVDTLRADHLGCYGYPLDVSPAIDAFARYAVLFEEAFAQSSWTRPSVASVLTGLLPPTHGANLRRHALRPEALTLAEVLAAAGYRTAAFVSNPNVAAELGFAQGFDHFDYLGSTEIDGVEVVDRAVEWLDGLAGGEDRPPFLFVHTVDPHSPYDPPPAYRRRFAPEAPASTVQQPNELLAGLHSGKTELDEGTLADIVALYDAEIAYNDSAFARLRAALEARRLWDAAVVTVLSDHGEEFYEHQGFEHGKTLYDESVRVPWILKLGDRGPVGRIPGAVQLVDLFPTLLEALGIPPPAGLEGRSLLPRMAASPGGPSPPPVPILTYLHLNGPPQAGLRGGGFQLLLQRDGDRWIRPLLFDLAADPGETENLAEKRPILSRYLDAQLRRRLLESGARALEPVDVELDEDLVRRLEALGYL